MWGFVVQESPATVNAPSLSYDNKAVYLSRSLSLSLYLSLCLSLFVKILAVDGRASKRHTPRQRLVRK